MPASKGVEFLKQITKIATSRGFEQYLKHVIIASFCHQYVNGSQNIFRLWLPAVAMDVV